MADPGYVDLPGTNRYSFEYDQTLPANQATSYVKSVSQNADADFALISSWFDGLVPAGVPFKVKVNPVSPTRGGSNDGGGNITIDSSLGNLAYGRATLAHESIEICMAAFNRGWIAGQSHGEALAEVTGFTVSPATVSMLLGPRLWVYAREPGSTTDRPDFVSKTDPTDTNAVSYGCGVLFLYYLQTQLGFSLRAIVQAGASTLEGVYQSLTHASNAWADFSALIDAKYPHWAPVAPQNSENPFPLPTTRKLSLKRYLSAHPLQAGETIRSRIRATNIGQLRALLNSDRPATLLV